MPNLPAPTTHKSRAANHESPHFYSTIKKSRNRYISLKTNDRCHFYSTMKPGGRQWHRHSCLWSGDLRSATVYSNLARIIADQIAIGSFSASQMKWDTVPLDFARNSLKTQQLRTHQVGHFFDDPGTLAIPIEPSERERDGLRLPNKCHTAPPFFIRNSLKTNKSRAQEVSQLGVSQFLDVRKAPLFGIAPAMRPPREPAAARKKFSAEFKARSMAGVEAPPLLQERARAFFIASGTEGQSHERKIETQPASAAEIFALAN